MEIELSDDELSDELSDEEEGKSPNAKTGKDGRMPTDSIDDSEIDSLSDSESV